ncbi:MAG TPA: UDP-N-acetylmuramoyl-L-alanyl-D-glutamate--2,6-diaminopimelate ligase [Acidimicrobiales bacterium]|nr:UDP-N-acetylmuramoyl-L-alanyl-D-glutamate--2,6-diaminopimelate ligase [Acidimicrobiales bacterium]
MTLLLDDISVLETVGDPAAADIRGVTHDSRQVRPGDLFCCLPGRGADGHRYAADAVARGAVGLLCEHLVDLPVPQARVAPGQARPAMAAAAAAFWGHPSRDLLMAGVTGTNGKTSVTHLLGAVLSHAGRPTTVLGTLSGARTTPEATELQRILAEARDGAPAGTQAAVAMEVSSHALAQSRVDGIHFDVAVFTNLSHDHLDYHGTMDDYFAAKASLFTPDRAVRGVVNAEDRWGRRLLAEARVPMVAVRADAASRVELAVGRSSFTWRGHRVDLAMTGAVNVHNAVLAAEAAVALGLDPAEVAAGLATAGPVPGRLEVVGSAELAVLVDYAHTPDGLAVVLAEARRLAGDGRVLVVFGCGGDRDRAKRPLMGGVAVRLADRAWLTSDNPRNEDPGAIIEEVLAGTGDAVGTGRLVVDPDRRSAIAAAVADAAPGDVVVVAGKGHEAVQVVGDRRLPFDDRTVVAEILAGPGDPAA